MANTSGYTLVELMVTVVVVSALAAFLFPAVINIFAGGTRGYNKAGLTLESQTILRGIVEQIRNGSSIRNTNLISDTNKGSNWNTADVDHVLIIASPATDSSGDFIENELTGLPYQDEFVYYVDGDSLYRRTLAHPLAVDNSRTTTCSVSSQTSSCTAGGPNDAELTTSFDDLSFVMYDQDNTVTATASAARSVEFRLNLIDRGLGKDPVVTSVNRMTFRNIGDGNGGA